MSMKKHLLLAAATLALGTAANAQIRYLDPTFTSVDVMDTVTYGQNVYFMPFQGSPIPPGSTTPTPGNLKMKVYKPSGDVQTSRPLVIILHTGNFLPRYLNQSTTGDWDDKAIVELANRFAKRGFVVSTPRYRLGWNPTGPPLTRVSTLLNAVYRAIHDAQTCVRHFRSSAASYGIDPDKIVLMGVGSGGYVSNAYATLDKQAETALPKFQDTSGNSVVNPAVVGDVNGVGGTANIVNYPGVSKQVAMVVNVGGALGDISWLEAGDVPMVGFHCRDDKFAPYDSGTVIVPTTQEPVVDVHGTRPMIRKAVALGNNDVILNRTFPDAVSGRAYSLNAKAQYEGLFEIRRPLLPGQFQEASPWDWWDSTAVVAGAAQFGMNVATANAIIASSRSTNPDVSQAKSNRYIDTIMAYSIPRIVVALNLPGQETVGIKENEASAGIAVYPNPVSANFSIDVKTDKLRSVTLMDLGGKPVKVWSNLNSNVSTLERGDVASGVYLVKVVTATGEFVRKVVLQ